MYIQHKFIMQNQCFGKIIPASRKFIGYKCEVAVSFIIKFLKLFANGFLIRITVCICFKIFCLDCCKISIIIMPISITNIIHKKNFGIYSTNQCVQRTGSFNRKMIRGNIDFFLKIHISICYSTDKLNIFAGRHSGNLLIIIVPYICSVKDSRV